MVAEIMGILESMAISEKKEVLSRFFKAGKGEYAEGDQFIGVVVPEQRKIAKRYFSNISLTQLVELLRSPIHEHRHCALLMLVLKFEKTQDESQQKEIVDFYLENRQYINNWDLVDCSCYKILGRYCYETGSDFHLTALAQQDHLWSQRIAVVSTMYHVKKGSFDLLKKLVLQNLQHRHDLIHKANGWLLREMGKKNEKELLDFLDLNLKSMPRTSLRYAIEKLDENLRQRYLKLKI